MSLCFTGVVTENGVNIVGGFPIKLEPVENMSEVSVRVKTVREVIGDPDTHTWTPDVQSNISDDLHRLDIRITSSTAASVVFLEEVLPSADPAPRSAAAVPPFSSVTD